jgi:hypothetical protein
MSTAEPGQLVYLQILPRISIEGRSSQAGDLSYWHDLDLSTDYWITKPRPAAILESSVDTGGYHRIKVIPIRQGPPVADAAMCNAVRIADAPSTLTNDILVPDWPLDDTYCYVFPCPDIFVSVPEVNISHSFISIWADSTLILGDGASSTL